MFHCILNPIPFFYRGELQTRVEIKCRHVQKWSREANMGQDEAHTAELKKI